MTRPRPYISKVHPWEWRHPNSDPTPGVALRQGPRIVAHLTPAEAIDLANRLVDLTEAMEG